MTHAGVGLKPGRCKCKNLQRSTATGCFTSSRDSRKIVFRSLMTN